MEPNTPNNKRKDEAGLKELILSVRFWIQYLLYKWKILIIALLAGSLVGMAFNFFSQNNFVAKSTFVLDETNDTNPLSALTGVTSILGDGTTNGSLFAGDNLIWLYSSDRMLGETLLTPAKNDSGKQVSFVNWLMEFDEDFNSAVYKVKKKYGSQYKDFPNNATASDQLSLSQNAVLSIAIATIRNDYLQVTNVGEKTTGIISVTVASPDELFSLDFTNTIVNHVNNFYIKTQTKKSQEQVDVLQKKVDEFNKSMNSSMYQAASSAQSIPYANPNLPTLDVTPQRKIIDVKLNSSIYTSMVQQLEAAKLTLANETPLIQVVDAPNLPLNTDSWGYPKSILIFGVNFFFLSLIFLIIIKVYKNAMEKK